MMSETSTSLASQAVGGQARVAAPPDRRQAWPPRRWAAEHLLGLAIALVSLVPVSRYLWVVGHRIGYPFELQWMEGGSVEVVRRVVEGHALYGPPSLHFTPWPYPPLYFWISAGVAHLTGVGFLPLRLVSLAASLVVLTLLYRMVTAETRDRVAGLVAAGLYAATYRLAGAWADIGRVDSLFLAFALGGLAAARRARSAGAGAVVGLAFFLSFFTKQDGLLIALPVVAWLLIAQRRAGVTALGVLIGLVGLSTVVLDAASHGWYRYYVFGELSSQGLAGSEWLGFWRHDLFHPLSLTVGLVVLGGLVGRRHLRSIGWAGLGFWLACGVGLLGAAWAGRLHSGGYDDVLMPAYAGVGLLAGLMVGWLRSHPVALARIGLSAGVFAVLALQLHRLDYPLGAQIPRAADRRAGDAFLAKLQHLPGQVMVFDHPFYSTLAGKGGGADEEAANGIERAGPSVARRLLVADMRASLLRPGLGAVILDNRNDERNLRAELQADYHLLPAPAVPGDDFFPVTDLELRPSLVFVRDLRPAHGTLDNGSRRAPGGRHG